MTKVKDSYNVNSMTQIAGEAALRDRKYFDWLVRSTITERIWLLENAAKFNWTYPKTDVRGARERAPLRRTQRPSKLCLSLTCRAPPPASCVGQFCPL